MRRLATIAVLPCSVALFIALAPVASADETTPPTTTAPPPTGTEPSTTTEPLPLPGPKLIRPGVTIGGMLVGGLTRQEARELVEQRFGAPITLVAPNKKVRVMPQELGAAAYVSKAVKTAVSVQREGFQVPLRVDVANKRLERFLAKLGKETDREPVDASLTLRRFTPVAHPSSPGRRLMQVVAAQKRLTRGHPQSPGVEEVRRRLCARQRHRVSAAAQCDAGGRRAGDALERRECGTVIEEIGDRQRTAIAPTLRIDHEDVGDRVLVAHRQRAQQHEVGEAEDDGIRTDGKRKREDDGEGITGLAQRNTNPVAKILEEGAHTATITSGCRRMFLQESGRPPPYSNGGGASGTGGTTRVNCPL